jgi:hypothetical protein
MPIGVGSIISAGAGLLSSGAKSDGASAANAANQQAIAEAQKIAQQGYDANKGYINQYGTEARGHLEKGYADTTEQFRPMIDQGDKARDYYGRATGLQGEEARNGYVNDLMARPEYSAARDLATRQTQQMYGNKLGSGAFARSLQKRDMEFANNNIDRDLNRVKPILDTGNQARFQQGNAATNFGNNMAGNSWRVGNAFISNENRLVDANVNLAGARGQSNAANAQAQGNADAQMFSGLGNAFGSAFGGGSGGGTKLSSFFS